MIMSVLQILCFFCLGIRPLTWDVSSGYWGLIMCYFIGFFSMVWIDTIVQGKLVKEARKDSKYGAIDLKYFEYACMCLGGVIPSCIGLAFSIKFDTRYYEFNIAALNGLFLLLLSLRAKDKSVNSNRVATRFEKEPIAGMSLWGFKS